MEKFSLRAAYGMTIEALTNLKSGNSASQALETFEGFGALKQLLKSIDDKNSWSSNDFRFEAEIMKIHDLLRELYPERYDGIISSIKNSVLTSFYTPGIIVDSILLPISKHFENNNGLTFLDPAAGTGRFVDSALKLFPNITATAIEKDELTFNFLKNTHPDLEVFHKGYEDFRNRKVDLIASNIPFGSINVYDDQIFREGNPVKIKSTTRIHNYFFVKSLDNLRENGILAFITSTGVMDSPSNKEIRRFLMDNAKLVNAIRLPNNVFEGSGTFPVTDIIILQKVSNKRGNLTRDEKLFIETNKVEIDGKEVNLNKFFGYHQENILGKLIVGGQYNGNDLDCEPREGFTPEGVTKDISNLIYESLSTGIDLTSNADPIEATKEQVVNVPVGYPYYTYLKTGNLVVIGNRVGSATVFESSVVFDLLPQIRDTDRVFYLSAVRDVYKALVEAELDSNESKMTLLRIELNQAYDKFVFQYGNIHLIHNKKILEFESESFTLYGLEMPDSGNYKKADIFSKQVNNVKKFVQVNSIEDAVLVSLNAKGIVDLELISSLIGLTAVAAARKGMDSGLLFFQGDNDSSTGYKIVTRDEFLSGNVVEKINFIQNKSGSLPSFFLQEDRSKHLDQLNLVRPPYLTRDLIDINLGVRWVPRDIYESFASDLFKVRTTIKYMVSLNEYQVLLENSSAESVITYMAATKTRNINGRELLEYAMIDVMPKPKIKVSSDPDVYIPDVEGIKNCETRIKQIREKFTEYTTSNIDIVRRLEKIYNTEINNFVQRKFDGKHLQFQGYDSYVPKNYQLDGCWKIIAEEGGLISHDMGAGKSLTIALAAIKLKQLGLSRKSLVLCLKANVDAVSKEIIKAFPKAKVLAPLEKDFTKEKRKILFSKIMSNDWDVVVMTHDNYKHIPQSPHVVQGVLNDELANIEDDLTAIKGNQALTVKLSKGLEKRKANMTAAIKLQEASINRDSYIVNFETMGFDHLFVDEAHEFKNLSFTTRQENVSGLGDKEGSQKARNLLFGVRTIQKLKKGDKGVTFLTGTPLSNSLVEMYLLKKYLRPNKLEKNSINSFDAWALMFAKKSTSFELTVTNQIKMKERYREFVNLPELKMWYAEMAHVVTTEDLKSDRPSLHTELVELEPSDDQLSYGENLVHFTKTKDGSYIDRPDLSDNEKNAFMLLATNLAKKMSLDMRLIDPGYQHYPLGKIGACASNLYKEYVDGRDFRSTQLVFCDIGTPGGENFSVYAALKDVLIFQYGVKESEVAFIHDFDTSKKKTLFSKLINNGDIRIAIGSTKKLGTGNNPQERLVALHDLDLPWRPSDMAQRGGRLPRPGAWAVAKYRNNIGKRYVYAVKKTLDPYLFNILSNKQLFIDQITKNSSLTVRRIDEGAIGDDGAMNYAEYSAILSGNTDLLDLVKAQAKLNDLERSKVAFISQRANNDYSLSRVKADVKLLEPILLKLNKDLSFLKTVDLESLPVVISGKSYKDRKTAGAHILETIDPLKKRSAGYVDTAIASISNFVLHFKTALQSSPSFYVKSELTGLKYSYAEGSISKSEAFVGRYIIDAVKRLPVIVENKTAEMNGMLSKIPVYENALKQVFPHDAEIARLNNLVSELDVRITKAAQEVDQKKNVNTEVESNSNNSNKRNRGRKTKI